MKLNKIIAFFYAIFIIILTWPIFTAWLPWLSKPWWLYPFGVVVALILAHEYFSSKQFKWLFFYTMVILLNSLMGDKYIYDPISVLTRSLALLILTSAPYILLNRIYIKSSNFLFNVFLILLIFTSVVSYYFNLQFPEVIRNDISITGSIEVYEYSYLYRFGLTRYQFAHAIPILIPPFVMAYKEKTTSLLNKLFFVSLIILCIIHTLVSGSTTAFLLSIIAVIMSFAVKAGSYHANLQRIVILSLLLLPLLSNDVVFTLLGIVDYFTGEGSIHEHIVDLQHSIIMESSTGDVSARQDLYTLSLKAFFSNPFIGTNDEMGNHSVFLDHLGAFGLIGFIPFFALLWSGYKHAEKAIGSENKYYYIVCLICAFGMLAAKNASIWANCCFLYIAAPIFFIRFSNSK